jgi:hypothetical protein
MSVVRSLSLQNRPRFLSRAQEEARLATLFESLRWAHIAAGTIALLLFWIPAIARKGGRTHVRAGWFCVACMSVVVVTPFAMSGLAFTTPLAIRRITRPLSPAELSNFLRSQRVFATFLAYLAHPL